MRTEPTFEQVERDLRSGPPETHGLAMQYLIVWTGKNPRIHGAALPLFQLMLSAAQDPWILSYAARGVELIQGPSLARGAWLGLLQHSSDAIASNAATLIDPREYVPELLQMLNTRSEVGTQMAAVRSLARTKNPEFLPLILPYLGKPATQVEAILALEQLEDPRALSHLAPLLQDASDSGMTDDRGCRLDIGQLAASATRRLQYVSGIPSPPATALHAMPPRNPASTTVTSPPVVQASAISPKTARTWLPLLPYVPLIAGLVEIPWVVVLIILQLAATQSGAPSTRLQTHSLDALALVLPATGLLAALHVIFRQPARRRTETIVLWLGSAMCVLIAAPFAWELCR